MLILLLKTILLDQLKSIWSVKNDKLKKYEMKINDVDVDVYLPYYSKLLIPIEEALKHTTKLKGFKTLKPEVLLILKQGAEIGRRGTLKGLKDRIDILLLLLKTDIDWKMYKGLLGKYKAEKMIDELIELIRDFDTRQLKYLGLNLREFKLWKEKMIKELKFL